MSDIVPSAASLTAVPRRPGWAREAWARLGRYTLLKTVGITAFMWLFFIAYFHLLRHPVVPVTQMPLTAIDRAIPFQPWGLPVYLSLWFYIGIAPGLLPTLPRLLAYGAWAAALCGAGLACFYLWPTAVPPHVVDVAAHPEFAVLQGVDAAGNACPSLHVATAIFTCLRLERLLREIGAPAGVRWLNVAWFVAIAFSTLAIKQHVALDVAAGAILGTLFALPAGWLERLQTVRR